MSPMWIAAYCLVSAVIQFVLGIAWQRTTFPQLVIKYGFLFASVWGAFIGAGIIKGYLL